MAGGKFWSGNTKAAKVTPTEVINIRADAQKGMTQNSLCHKYDLSIAQIGRIVRGESWRGVKQEPTVFDVEASARRLMAIQQEVDTRSATQKMQDALKAEKEKNQAGDKYLDELTGDRNESGKA